MGRKPFRGLYGVDFLDRSLLLKIICGLVVFIAISSYILLNHADFDEQLIEQVENGVPSQDLINEIDEEAYNMQVAAKKRLDSKILDRKYWGNGELDSPLDYSFYVDSYESELKLIKEYKEYRVKYANREITREEFLSLTQNHRDYFNGLRII